MFGRAHATQQPVRETRARDDSLLLSP
jgi:hypothetical protein